MFQDKSKTIIVDGAEGLSLADFNETYQRWGRFEAVHFTPEGLAKLICEDAATAQRMKSAFPNVKVKGKKLKVVKE